MFKKWKKFTQETLTEFCPQNGKSLIKKFSKSSCPRRGKCLT